MYMAKIKKQKKQPKQYAQLRVNIDTNNKLKVMSEKSGLYIIEIIGELVDRKYAEID